MFTARLSDGGQAAARTAINTWLYGCVASHDAVPAHCPFGTYAVSAGGGALFTPLISDSGPGAQAGA